jgi:hypothetical protein
MHGFWYSPSGTTKPGDPLEDQAHGTCPETRCPVIVLSLTWLSCLDCLLMPVRRWNTRHDGRFALRYFVLLGMSPRSKEVPREN